jgi:preprotein translocase subunit SecF
MINREFTTREKIMLLVLAVVLLAVGYFRFFLTPLQSEIETQQQRQAEVEDSVLLAEKKLMTQKQMQSKIDELKESGTVPDAEVAEYDNIENVMLQLNAILSQADEYSLSFDAVSTDDNGTVTRPVELTFTASSYTAARSIINNLYQCPYRCAVSDISESSDTDLSTDGEIQVDLTVTFYEKTAD